MKTTEENRTMNPGDRWVPGDVYMMLSPEGKTQAVAANDRFYKNFGHFINHCTEAMIQDWLMPYPNSFFVHYRFADPGRVWKPYENISMFPRKLRDAIKEQGLKPLNTCRLYPAIYCCQNGLDPLLPENSHEALNKSKTYQSAAWRYSGLERGSEKTYTGIETDRGVLLFDNTERGEKLQEEYKKLFTANFFDPRLDVTFFRTLELIPDEEQKAKVNPALDSLFMPGMEPFVERPADAYIDMKDIGIYTESERYDMSPTLDNFACFTGLDRGELPELPGDTYDISCLLYLSSPDCKDPVIQDDFPYYFSYYDRFDPLCDRFAEAATEGEKTPIMASVRELAGHLLERDFPNIRRPQAATPERKEQFGVAGATAEKPARQLPDVAKRLANRPKKGKGITR